MNRVTHDQMPLQFPSTPSTPLPPDRAFYQAYADPAGLEAKFQKYDRDHPDVWREFRAAALRLYAAGIQHYGAKAIFEAIRFHRAVDGRLGPDGDDFKINNNYPSRYARKLAAEDPARFGHGFFAFRLLRSA